MPKNQIEVAIGCNNIKYLSEVSIDNLITFRDQKKGLNAFLYACYENCKYQVINLILDRTIDYFSKKIINSKDYKKLELKDDEIIDITKCGESSDDFFKFFYETVEVKGMDLNAAALALMNDNTDSANIIRERLYLYPVHHEFLPQDKQRREVFGFITKKYGEGQSAYFSSELPHILRPPRKFYKERERQLLKQLSTVLFFYIKANGSKCLKEVEILHLSIGDVSHLIISCNGGDDLGESFKIIGTMNDLHSKLKEEIHIKRDDGEAGVRLQRYQDILKCIFQTDEEIGFDCTHNEDHSDIGNYQKIINILQNKNIIIRCINNYPKLRKEELVAKDIRELLKAVESSIIILDNKLAAKEIGLHAEEYLIDFLEVVNFYNQKDSLNKKLYSCIGGKKRPCFTCYATMFNFKEVELNYGKRPGYAWKRAFYLQEKSNSGNSKLTLLTMLGKNSNITKTKAGNLMSGYDSGSDDEEIQNEKNAYKI